MAESEEQKKSTPDHPDDVVVALSTFPDSETAAKVAEALVKKKICACVNLLPEAESIYQWEGAIQRDSEVVALIKTTAARLAELEQALVERHPYEVPEFVVLPVTGGSRAFLDWVRGNR